MGKYEVVESVWLATAIMAYERFYNSENPKQEEMYFKQVDIQKRAKDLCKQNVESARISQWCNADHGQNTNNYLREGVNSTRRLTHDGEFQGNKEVPNLNPNDVVVTSKGPITIAKIKEFVSGDYARLFVTTSFQKSEEDIDCISILDYLDNYNGKPYENPETADPSIKQELFDIKRAGGAAANELEKIAELCVRSFGLKKYKGKSKWLNGANNKVRGYLWRQLKLAAFEERPTSISLVAEMVDGKARFKFSVELDEKESSTSDYQNHHRILNKDILEATEKLTYILGGNDSETTMKELAYTTKEVKQGVKDKKYKKIQIARIITREDIKEELYDNQGIIKVIKNAVGALIPYYNLAVAGKEIINNPGEILNVATNPIGAVGKMDMLESYKNLILYGPPGTGKTYNTVIYAVAIIENSSVKETEKEDYTLVLKRYNDYKKNGRIAFTTFHQSYGYEEFIEGIKPCLIEDEENPGEKLEYKIEPGVFKKFCDDVDNYNLESSNKENFVFIIDEINRGNISKLFGELITLIEVTKRKGEKEESTAKLPYSRTDFGVPNNVFIIGTMNTADRSIAIMDTALRRRFKFIEMPPREEVLSSIRVGNINVMKMLKTINSRIELLFDREHTIGHAFFTSLVGDPSLDRLSEIFRNSIIPLMQEYFYEDYSKIQLVLGDNVKDPEFKFIKEETVNSKDFFKGITDIEFSEYRYTIQNAAFNREESYIQIY